MPLNSMAKMIGKFTSGTRVRFKVSGAVEIQVRYGGIWSERVGSETGQMQEILLEDDEAVIQVSGKYGLNIQWLVFVTNKGRSLYSGQPTGWSFDRVRHSLGCVPPGVKEGVKEIISVRKENPSLNRNGDLRHNLSPSTTPSSDPEQ
uniref:Jacalin-type lectin domain-containing protein n=1 Tax=Periophthalmus magnuspinnatus TaxID=409849 RepID=A0A3B3Z918_9GOBI